MKEPSPSVSLEIGNRIEKTDPRHASTNPKWERTFLFLVTDPEVQELTVEVSWPTRWPIIVNAQRLTFSVIHLFNFVTWNLCLNLFFELCRLVQPWLSHISDLISWILEHWTFHWNCINLVTNCVPSMTLEFFVCRSLTVEITIRSWATVRLSWALCCLRLTWLSLDLFRWKTPRANAASAWLLSFGWGVQFHCLWKLRL